LHFGVFETLTSGTPSVASGASHELVTNLTDTNLAIVYICYIAQLLKTLRQVRCHFLRYF